MNDEARTPREHLVLPNQYQRWTRTVAIYPQEDTLSYLSLGLAGEAGEIANRAKKVLRDRNRMGREELRAELGDVLWYVARMADEHGLLLSEVMLSNVEKLEDRKERDQLRGSGDER